MRSDIAAAVVHHTAEKMSQTEVGYSRGTKEAHCGICKHYAHPHVCEIVAGKIFPGDVVPVFRKGEIDGNAAVFSVASKRYCRRDG